ncbi:MAG: FlgD immunoglobulin-like domain containing protein [Candidatus Edwardsbacteria bacterium]
MKKIMVALLLSTVLPTSVLVQDRSRYSKPLVAPSLQGVTIEPGENRDTKVFNMGKIEVFHSNEITTTKSPAETLKYDTGPYWGSYADVPYWAVRFSPTSTNPVRAALVYLWVYSGSPVSCSLYVWDWDSVNNRPGKIKMGPIYFTSATGWIQIDLPQPYFDEDDFAIGYFLPFPSGADTTLAVSDQLTNYPDRSWIGDSISWTRFYDAGGIGDLCIRAIVDLADHDVAPISITAPERFVKPNTIIQPQAIIKNLARNPDTVDVTFRIEGTSLYSCTKKVIIGSNSQKTVTFENWAPPSLPEIKSNATVYTQLPTDQNLKNDTLKMSIQTTEAKILLVSDEYDGYNVPEYWDTLYVRILQENGFDSTKYDLWDYPCWGGVRDELLNLYDVIVWYTGTSNGNPASSSYANLSLSPSDRAGLIRWLESGTSIKPKNLCLSGMWILWNTIADAYNQIQLSDSLFDYYFHLSYPKENFTDWIKVDSLWKLEAAPGGFVTSKSVPIYWRSKENFPDQLDTLSGFSQGVMKWLDGGDTTHNLACISHSGGYFKTVIFTCPFEGMFQPEVVMRDMLHWFGILTGAEEQQNAECGMRNAEWRLMQNYPNPFNQATAIKYQIAKDCNVRIKIYNVNCQLVRILVDEKKKPGIYEVKWDGKDSSGKSVASGTYYYQLDAGGFAETKKMVVLR